MSRPTEPLPTQWVLPPAATADDQGIVGIGADLEAGTLLAAYRAGLFPMPIGNRNTLAWWSPDPRGIIPLDELRISRSLRKSCTRFEIRVDTAFDAVIRACAAPTRPHGWISGPIRAAYSALHEMGWVHSIEAWDVRDDVLAGGLYGVAIGGLFAGESMFHHRTDASKVALVGLVDLLRSDGSGGAGRLLDVQWTTEHLATLGARDVPRDRYLRLLRAALDLPLPPVL
ncbi:MAG TPA: leucyl/phenylalanyl-tRNA--protein transferase [Acidimicrobiales bacterium]|nr:leucyl/phenylalanyl-tRNA--protein transferase [Acidimicrobiales bacterium]